MKTDIVEGAVVQLADARWFEHKNPFHSGVIQAGDKVTVISEPLPVDSPKRLHDHQVFTAWVLHGTTVGFIRLTNWVDEVCDDAAPAKNAA